MARLVLRQGGFDQVNAGAVRNPYPNTAEGRMLWELQEAERKAWDALSRYKFQMFGYWAAIWVHLNRISGQKLPNPWAELVRDARQELSDWPAPPPKLKLVAGGAR